MITTTVAKTCENCKYIYHLWYWDNYPCDQKLGYCCVFPKEEVVIQLHELQGHCPYWEHGNESIYKRTGIGFECSLQI